MSGQEVKPANPNHTTYWFNIERIAQLEAQLVQAETAVRTLLEVTEHGSNSGPVFEARVVAYSFLRRAR